MQKKVISITLSLILVLLAANFAFSNDSTEVPPLPPENGWTLLKPLTIQIFNQQGPRVWIEEYYYKKNENNPNAEIFIIGYFVNNGKKHKVWGNYYRFSMNEKRKIQSVVWFLKDGSTYTQKEDDIFYQKNSPTHIMFGLHGEKHKNKILSFSINDENSINKTNTTAPLGTKVFITKDMFLIHTATIIDFIKRGWQLYDKDGNLLTWKSNKLPDGFVEWSWKTEKFPGQKYGIQILHPVFILDDGVIITEQEYNWFIADPELRKQEEKKDIENDKEKQKKIKKYWEEKQNAD